MNAGPIDLSVIIPHANDSRSLRTLIRSLGAQDMSSFEVIVVSNPEGKNPTAPSFDMPFPLRWAESPAGANHARQKGVAIARGKILVFLDDDCELSSPSFLRSHMERHSSHPELAGVGGFYRLSGSSTLWGRIYHGLQVKWLRDHRLPSGDCVHLLGGNSSYKREVFDHEGFDPKIIFGGTEAEFQLRLHRRRDRLRYFEDLEVGHDGRLGPWSFVKKAFKQGLGHEYIRARHERPARFVFYSPEERFSAREKAARWLYAVSFDAGREFFLRTGRMRVSGAAIAAGVFRQSLKTLRAGGLPHSREVRNLLNLAETGLIASKHSDDQDSPPKRSDP